MSRSIPTVAAYIEMAEGAVTDGTLRAYRPYWKELKKDFGKRQLHTVKTTELRKSALEVGKRGPSAGEHYVAAARCLWQFAIEDGFVERNPALKVPKPMRSQSKRRSLTDVELEELWHVAASTGNDPELDTLLLRFHLESGARRSGALTAKVSDVDDVHCTIELTEKFGRKRSQPIGLMLTHALLGHARSRPGETELLFRYKNGRPLTRKRYETLFARFRNELAWAEKQELSSHWLRHTAITYIERVTNSYAIARRFAGHSEKTPTDTYLSTSINDVARALELVTGEKHPLSNLEPIPELRDVTESFPPDDLMFAAANDLLDVNSHLLTLFANANDEGRECQEFNFNIVDVEADFVGEAVSIADALDADAEAITVPMADFLGPFELVRDVPDRCLSFVKNEFGAQWKDAVVWLSYLPGRSERLTTAAVVQAKGSTRELRLAVELGRADYRDLFMNAGLADENWPQVLDKLLGQGPDGS